MSVLNQFVKLWTGSQSVPETSSQLMVADPSSTALVLKTRTRRVGSDTYTYTGGSAAAAKALQIELEATPGMGAVYLYADDASNAQSTWTVTASPPTTTEWGPWI